jgi:hypothetical protein
MTSCHQQQSQCHRLGNNFRFFYETVCDLPDFLRCMTSINAMMSLMETFNFPVYLQLGYTPWFTTAVLFSTSPCRPMLFVSANIFRKLIVEIF